MTVESKNKISTSLRGIGKFTHIKYCKCEICNLEFLWNSITRGSKRHCTNAECFKKFKHNVRKGKTGGYRPNSTRVHRSIYKGYQMDSGAELVFAQICDFNNIVWIKNKDIFFEFTYPDGSTGKYYPDFFLPDINRWIEIKGPKYVREHDDLRLAAANAILIMSPKLKDIEYVLSVIHSERNRDRTDLNIHSDSVATTPGSPYAIN